MRSLKNGVRLLLGLSLAASTQIAVADYPDHAIRLIVPFPAGGATDIVSRVVAKHASEKLGQQIVVENKTGAGGTIGSAEVAKAKPDGYTLLLTTNSTHSIAPHLHANLSYDAIEDFEPIAHMADVTMVVVVNPQLPVSTLAELVDYAKAHPKELNYASSGNGTIVHLANEAFNNEAGIELTHVPYRGTGQAIADMASGSVNVLFDAMASAIPHLEAGRFKPLAVTTLERNAVLPDIPTISESYLPGFSANAWFGLFAPKGTPEDRLEVIYNAFTESIRDPEVIESMRRVGVDQPSTEGKEAFVEMFQADSDRWAKVIKDNNITLQ